MKTFKQYCESNNYLNISPWDFDQTPIGWRSIRNNKEKIDIIKKYIELNYKNDKFIGKNEGKQHLPISNLYWHLGQILAFEKNYKEAISYMKKSKSIHDYDHNNYADATIAFIEREFGNKVKENSETIERLRNNWDKSYEEAYLSD